MTLLKTTVWDTLDMAVATAALTKVRRVGGGAIALGRGAGGETVGG